MSWVTSITVMLVTHDIDEAVRMADRVAVLSPGAHIEQLASPLDIVARPATPAVADLVGRGRTARLLALGRLERADLDQGVQQGTGGPPLTVGAELGDVLSALVGADGPVPVLDEHGQVVGSATPATVVRALDRLTEGDDETHPTADAGAPVGTLRT